MYVHVCTCTAHYAHVVHISTTCRLYMYVYVHAQHVCTFTACMYMYMHSMYVQVQHACICTYIVWNVLQSVEAIPVVRLAPADRDTNINIHHNIINTSSEVVTNKEDTGPFCAIVRTSSKSTSLWSHTRGNIIYKIGTCYLQLMFTTVLPKIELQLLFDIIVLYYLLYNNYRQRQQCCLMYVVGS